MSAEDFYPIYYVYQIKMMAARAEGRGEDLASLLADFQQIKWLVNRGIEEVEEEIERREAIEAEEEWIDDDR